MDWGGGWMVLGAHIIWSCTVHPQSQGMFISHNIVFEYGWPLSLRSIHGYNNNEAADVDWVSEYQMIIYNTGKH